MNKIIKARLIILSIFLVIMNLSCFAQEFQLNQIEQFKRELMRNTSPKLPNSNSPVNLNSQEAIKKTAESAGISTSKINLPTTQDVLIKNDVAHINPDTYKLGPGDKMQVNIYGLVNENIQVTVQPDGTIFINPAGTIKIKNLTINQARKKIFRILKKYFKNFKISIQMMNLRTFKVEVLGEVKQPGSYVITPTVGVCDVLGLAGGLKSSASLRNIKVKYKNKKYRADIFAWYYMGNSKENKLLTEKCTIFVPLMKDKISVEGSFKRTGTFEIVPGEKIGNILKMVQPGTGALLSEAKLTRISDDNDLKIFPIHLEKILDNPKTEDNLVLADGDVLFVPNLSVFLDKITVVGELQGANLFTKTINRLTGQQEIRKIGQYKLRENEKVKDVIIALGGPTVQADLEKTRIERPDKNGIIKVIPVNLRKLLYDDDNTQNKELLAGDSLIIPAKPTNIYILGEIRSPGMYQYNVGNKIKEYVALAGGPTSRARMRMTKVIQKIGNKTVVHNIDLRSILTGNLEESFELRPGDVIFIPYADIASWKDIVRTVTDLIIIKQLFN